MFPLMTEICVSRNATCAEDQWVVNLMEGWWLLRSRIKLLYNGGGYILLFFFE